MRPYRRRHGLVRGLLLPLAMIVALRGVCSAEGQWDPEFGLPGMDGTAVWELIAYRGGVVALGDFTSAGGIPCNRIAFWNGSRWSPLGDGVSGLAECAVVIGEDLYVGGAFPSAADAPGTHGVARWDGSTWHSLGGGVNDRVYAMTVFEGRLVVGGRFTLAGSTPASNVATWDGETWFPLGPGFTAGEPMPSVWCFAMYEGNLVAGGRFSRAGTSVVNRVARWDGTAWQPLGTGVSGSDSPSVFDMIVYEGDLIVGGTFQTAGGQQAESLARWDGVSWHAMAANGFIDAWPEVHSLEAQGPRLVVGGVFTGLTGVPFTRGLAGWEGAQWSEIGGGASGHVYSLLSWGDHLLAGGLFSSVGPFASVHIAHWQDEGAWSLQVADVPDDQGGFLRASWRAHAADVAGATPPVTSYELQRADADWVLVAARAAAQADSYEVTFETSDVAMAGQPPAASTFRIVARTTEPPSEQASWGVKAFSTDDLLPDPPQLVVSDSTTYRVLFSARPPTPDLAELCLYRGSEPGFIAGEPLICYEGPLLYLEEDLLRYHYRARAFDLHGNASEWSNEVVGRYPTGVPPSEWLQIHPCQPNPFNPRTQIRFDLPRGMSVRLAVYDARGRLVRVLLEGVLSPGAHEVPWDGLDGQGRHAPSGNYFAKLTASGRAVVRGMRLVR